VSRGIDQARPARDVAPDGKVTVEIAYRDNPVRLRRRRCTDSQCGNQGNGGEAGGSPQTMKHLATPRPIAPRWGATAALLSTGSCPFIETARDSQAPILR
jgi:hypothetical protein